MNELLADDALLERMVRAVEKVRERMQRAARALTQAGVPYAIAGGNAVAAWVATIDEAAMRNTQDVDIVLRRGDFEAAQAALSNAGFVYRHAASLDMFLDGAGGKARDAVHVLFAGEKVRPENGLPVPDVDKIFVKDRVAFLALAELVPMKLTSNRRKDQVHIEDMLDVGLIDASWLDKLPPELAARLQHLIDTPDG
ncbi:MAG: hypothetical protein WD872_02590 [Pirellulaceae bacterium]